MAVTILFNGVLQLLAIFLSLALTPVESQIRHYPTAKAPSKWTNNNFSILSSSGSAQIILFNQKQNSVLNTKRSASNSSRVGFACGFYSYNGKGNSFYFVVGSARIWSNETSGREILDINVLWSANRNNPVSVNATLEFLPYGDLVLRDADGTWVWSTNMTNNSIVAMEMMPTGNLVLRDRNNKTIWQSFDLPTDTLLPGQKLFPGQKLVAAISDTNISEGSFYLSVNSQGVFAFYQSQNYLRYLVNGTMQSMELSYDDFVDGMFDLRIFSSASSDPYREYAGAVNYSVTAYVKLDPDGHLKLYSDSKNESVDLLDANVDYVDGAGNVRINVMETCDYPTPCGNFGLCSDGNCSCPEGFALDERLHSEEKFGCLETKQFSCSNLQSHYLLPLKEVHYFNYIDPFAAVYKGVDIERCKETCLKNCSCKAAFFQYQKNFSYGNCYLPSPVLSLINENKRRDGYHSYAFVKIANESSGKGPNVPPVSGEGRVNSHKVAIRTKIIAGSVAAGLVIVSLTVGLYIMYLKKKKNRERGVEDNLEELSKLCRRFTYKELKLATADFRNKLGEGGFGSVFEGSLGNGERIAVKRLEIFGQGKKEFLAEVKTIGSVHHVNLVRLIGFCAEKLQRLLVYEYMCNGSLDKWIFYKEPKHPPLDWQSRREIILGIAKGLAYLHEECRQRIVHLDIKPQNILLDETLCAKISDFGLCKLIDRDKSKVVTTMRGTPGYLAPEWFSSVITEKVDVYSFGVVVMETVCGRKNVDRSQPEERFHLLPVLMEKAENNELIDLVDKHSDDMQLHNSEAMEMMRVAVWCLQSDFNKRPSMSTVVKVLEGSADIETKLDYTIQNPTMATATKGYGTSSTVTLMPSVLSAPR